MAEEERTVTRVKSFFQAVTEGDRDRVAALLDADPELIEARDEEGRTGLLLAIYHGHHELVNLLSARRSEVDIFEASASGDAPRILELLRDEPRRVGYTSTDGFSPLGLASFFGHPDIVDLLVQCGADPNCPSQNAMKVTPLHSAAAHRDGTTALEICRRLLLAGADPNSGQAGGWKPLHQAAAQGNAPLVRLLLREGADPARTSDDGRTPLDMGREKGAAEVVALLEGR